MVELQDNSNLATGLAMTAIHLVSGFGRRSFGLGYAALHLAAAVHRSGARVYLSSLDDAQDAIEACEAAGIPGDRFISGSPMIGKGLLRVPPFLPSRLAKIAETGNTVVHLHGMWTSISWVAAALRKHSQCPLVMSPHGSLEPYALSISPWKKELAAKLFERANVMKASCMWALSAQEEESIRSWGYTGRVVVLPNGVSRAEECAQEELVSFRRRHNIDCDARILLYLGRITPKKNLPLLLRSLAKALPLASKWVLVIAGSDEGGHLYEVKALIEQLGIERHVRFIGRVAGREKACAFHSASIFVLPSYSEGLPIAVLEAMEYGLPLLITDGWTLPLGDGARYGWRSPVQDDAFQATLLDAMNTSDSVLAQIGQEARLTVREHYDWSRIGDSACRLYSSLLSQSSAR